MLTILERLDRALLEADEPKVKIIDLRDQGEAKRALNNTRGPSVGWHEYEAGNDYQPPYVWNTMDNAELEKFNLAADKKGEVWHKGNAVHQVHMPAEIMGPKDTMGNPFSAKYGGVRPWSPGEVIQVLSAQTGDPDTEGKIYQIANKPTVLQSYEVAGKTFDIEDAVALGTLAALRTLERDEGRPGIRFPSFAGREIETGIIKGIPPGYGDEYRLSRGMLLALSKIGKKARVKISKGKNVGAETDDVIARILPLIHDAESAEKTGQREGSINMGAFGTRGPLGLLLPQLLDAGSTMLTAIRSNNVDEVTKALEFAERLKDKITNEEEDYRIRGSSTDTTITKSAEQPTIGMSPMTLTSPTTGQELERGDFLSPGLSPTVHRLELSEHDREARDEMLSKDYKLDSYQYDDLSTVEQLRIVNDILSKYRTTLTKGEIKRGEKPSVVDIKIFKTMKAPQKIALNIPKVKLDLVKEFAKGGRMHSGGSEHVPSQGVDTNSERRKEMITQLLHRVHTSGRGEGVGWAADLARQVLAKFRQIVELSGEERVGRKYEIIPGVQEFQVVDVETTNVMSRHDFRAEAERSLEELQQANPLLTTVESLMNNITSQYGEYGDELKAIGQLILGLLHGEGDPVEIMQEIDELDQVAQGDQTSGERTVGGQAMKKTPKKASDWPSQSMGVLSSFSQKQYRVLLRMYGISNYPERGTIDDPEFDPATGKLSNWAQSGYPAVSDNNYIIQDLGGASARITQLKNAVMRILANLVESIQQELYQNGEIDEIDYDVLTELRVHLGRALLAEVRQKHQLMMS